MAPFGGGTDALEVMIEQSLQVTVEQSSVGTYSTTICQEDFSRCSDMSDLRHLKLRHRFVAVCCSVLRCVALCCSVLQ